LWQRKWQPDHDDRIQRCFDVTVKQNVPARKHLLQCVGCAHRLPDELAANSRLKIIDLCGNPLRRLSDIEVRRRSRLMLFVTPRQMAQFVWTMARLALGKPVFNGHSMLSCYSTRQKAEIGALSSCQVLARLPLLQQLNVKGCPLAAADAGHPDALLAALPLVEILDGKRVRPRIRGRLATAPGAAAGRPPAAKAAGAGGEAINGTVAAATAAGGKAATAADAGKGAAGSSQLEAVGRDGSKRPGVAAAGAADEGPRREAEAKPQQQRAALGGRKRRKDGTSAAQPAAAGDAASAPAAAARKSPAAPGSSKAVAASKAKAAQPAKAQPAASDSDSDVEPAAEPAGGRSFLEEVFTPDSGAAVAARGPDSKAAAGGSKGRGASGVVAVLGAEGSKKKRQRKKKAKTAEPEAAEGAAAAPSAAAVLTGAAAAQLLQSDRGIAVAEVGAGAADGWSAWDEPAPAALPAPAAAAAGKAPAAAPGRAAPGRAGRRKEAPKEEGAAGAKGQAAEVSAHGSGRKQSVKKQKR